MFRTSSVLLVGALAGLVFTGCSSGGGDNLTVYSGRTEDLVAPILSEFEKESGVDVDVRYGTSAELAVLIDTEGDKGPDVFLSQSPGAMGYLDGKGRLIKLDAATLDRVPERFRAEDGDWVGLSGRVRIVVYNADKTDEADVPDSALDFTDPKYKGKFGVAPTNGSFQDFVTVMRSQRGDEATLAWLEGIKANGARTYENNIAVREAVARGEIDFGLINHYYNERAKAEDPATPTENHFLNNQDAGAARLSSLPRSLEEGARALGRSPRSVFRTIVLPQCVGAMWAGTLLVFLYCLSEFGAVQLLRYDTLTRAIYSAWLFDRDVALSLSLVLVAVAFIVVFTERTVTRRRAQTEAVAAASDVVQTPLGAWKIPALAFVALVMLIALAVPIAVLGHWTYRGIAGSAQLSFADIIQPAITTAWLGLASAAIAVAIVLPVAFLTGRYRSRVGEAANAIVVSGFALPGLVIAIAIVFFVVQSPLADALYQTYALLLLAYAVHFGAQSLRASQVAVGAVPRRVEDAARSLGADTTRRLRTVMLPLMRPGLLAGAGLVLLSTMKELPATLILAPTGTKTLATEIWSSSSEGFFAQAGLASLALLALSAALTWLLVIRGREAIT
ncbi:MAG TPA: extracellular solute-binding protein [Acidimicrobiia bacterium]|nr:extracellular solute-binding protein [Acidimicrobiia bacterium]